MNQEIRYTKILTLFFVAVLFLIAASSTPAAAEPALKALIADGQNNHDWAATTPVLKEILEDTGLFVVDVATSPSQGKPMDSYKPSFAEYDVVVLNYTGDDWPEETQTAFVNYVESGGGVVVFHAANNAFPKWKEFNEIIGLGGWGGRNEKSGPMVRYRDGKVMFDISPGSGGTHGPQREYEVVIRDNGHPITKGLPEVWMHAKDELYAKLRGPAKNLHVLATSQSKLTNEHEPMLFTIHYGKGRIFHDALGHGPYAMSCAGFAFTLQRGTEWAATGKVTLTDVPGNFPTADQVSFSQKPIDWAAIKKYTFETSRKPLSVIEENLRNAATPQIKQIEQGLIEILQDSGAIFEAKQFACRMLRRAGSEACLPVLEKLLRDEKLSNMARFAMQGNPSAKADAILRKALSELNGDLRIGIIGAIAQRGDREAVEQIAQYLAVDDALLAETSIKALGHIGGRDAAQALSQAEVSDSLSALRDDSLLLCLDNWVKRGGGENAARMYQQIAESEKPVMTRLAAYLGLIVCNPENAIPTVISLLNGDEPALRQAAAGPFLRLIPGSQASKALADALPPLSPEAQTMTISALAARGDSIVQPAIVTAAGSDNEAVKTAALKALSVLGDTGHVTLLAKAASQGGESGKAAFQSLVALKNADDMILLKLKSAGTEIQPVLIRALTDRRTDGAAAEFLTLALNKNADVSKAAIQGLTQLSGMENLPQLLQLIARLKDSDSIKVIEQTVLEIAKRIEDADQRAGYFLEAMYSSPASVRASIIGMLSQFGGQRAFEAIKKALDTDYDVTIKQAAIQAFINWPDATPIDLVFSYAKNESELIPQSKALKGYLRLADLLRDDSIEQTLGRYRAAMKAARFPEEKQIVIEALSKRTNAAVLDFLEEYLDDPSVKDAALTGYKTIIKQLKSSDVDRSKWILSASHNSGNTKNAIDGNRRSRWDTGATQVPGMWFQIDLGAERTIEEITLDATGSNGDYPRGYEVYLSFGSGNWGEPVAKGKGNGPVTKIAIPSKSARFVKIVQTGKVDGLFWSIHELNMKVSSNKDTLEHAYEVLKKYGK